MLLQKSNKTHDTCNQGHGDAETASTTSGNHQRGNRTGGGSVNRLRGEAADWAGDGGGLDGNTASGWSSGSSVVGADGVESSGWGGATRGDASWAAWATGCGDDAGGG
jgi:hypothetical protein